MMTAIERVLMEHEKKCSEVEFSKWLSENKHELMREEAYTAELYANLCVNLHVEGRSVLKFKSFLALEKLHNELDK